MTLKYILALVLIIPFITISSMAQNVDRHVYQGGPKSAVPHTTRQVTTSARDAYAMVPRRSHGYSGGPQTVVPHTY
jgi:hypothetical protein